MKDLFELFADFNYLYVKDNVSLSALNKLLVDKNYSYVIFESDNKIIGYINKNNINLIKNNLLKENTSVNKIIMTDFMILDSENKTVNTLNNIINNNLKLIILVDENHNIKGLVNNTNINKYYRGLIDSLLENNKKIRHDLRGVAFTLNTSCEIIDKNPSKTSQVIKIIKKTNLSLNEIINNWKKTET